MRLSIKKITAWIIVFCAVTYSQNIPSSPREGLYQALEIYSLGRYEDAYLMFKSLSEFYVLDEHHSIFRFMAAKSLYKAGDFEKARLEFERFCKEFPGSSYISAANLYLGHIAYLNDNLYKSASRYLKANNLAPNSKAGEIAADNLIPMLENELSINELSSLIDNYPKSNLAGEIVYNLGKRLFEQQKYKRAIRLFEKYLENYAPSNHSAEVKELLSTCKENIHNKVAIGVLAPLSGSFADYGQSLVEGVKLVFEENNEINGKRVELIIKDTKGSPVYATMAVSQLALDEPVAIIGPLRSESAVGAAVVASFHNIPIITPTASESGIAKLGENVYQVSPPAEVMAVTMAEYAVNKMGIKEFGIIAPGDFTGRQVSKAFTQRVYQLGGEVLSNTFYETGQVDFTNQIKPLREVLLMKTEELLATQQIDSTEYYDFEKEEWLEQDDWRVHLGGLFLPGYAEELSLLIPQIRYHVISTQYLGLDGWDSPKLIGSIERYIQGSVFATDYHPLSENKIWNDFYTEFYKKYKHESDRVSALSYDVANLIKMALENGADSAEDVNSYLGSVESYNGTGCTINFKSTNHANNSVGIFIIEDNTIKKLK